MSIPEMTVAELETAISAVGQAVRKMGDDFTSLAFCALKKSAYGEVTEQYAKAVAEFWRKLSDAGMHIPEMSATVENAEVQIVEREIPNEQR